MIGALMELLVGLLTVLAIGAAMWFTGVYIIVGLVGFGALFILWALGNSIVETIKGPR